MAVAIVAFSWWASGWITAPLLSEFARASEGLGVDVNALPHAEDGPEEVRAAARALNLMQTRIRSFVEDRLRMLAAVSHDLRGPITRLRLREQVEMDAGSQAKMLSDLDEMAQVVDSSLAFARDEATEEANQPVDLAALLSTLCDDAVAPGHKAEFAWEGRLVYQWIAPTCGTIRRPAQESAAVAAGAGRGPVHVLKPTGNASPFRALTVGSARINRSQRRAAVPCRSWLAQESPESGRVVATPHESPPRLADLRALGVLDRRNDACQSVCDLRRQVRQHRVAYAFHCGAWIDGGHLGFSRACVLDDDVTR